MGGGVAKKTIEKKVSFWADRQEWSTDVPICFNVKEGRDGFFMIKEFCHVGSEHYAYLYRRGCDPSHSLSGSSILVILTGPTLYFSWLQWHYPSYNIVASVD